MSDSQKIARAVVEKIRSDRASRGTIMAQWMVDEWVALVTPVIEEAFAADLAVMAKQHNALEAAGKECDRLRRVVELKDATIERYLPCPDCRDKVQRDECQRCARQTAEKRADDFKATGQQFEADVRKHFEQSCKNLQRAEAAEKELAWLRVDNPCPECGGRGLKVYGDTSIWRKRGGGQTITTDVCDVCWGSRTSNRTGANLRKMDGCISALEFRAQAAEKERDELRAEVAGQKSKAGVLETENEMLKAEAGRLRLHAADYAALHLAEHRARHESERLTQRVRELEAGLLRTKQFAEAGRTAGHFTEAVFQSIWQLCDTLLSQPPAPQPSAIVCAQIIPQSSPPDAASPNADHGTARRHCVCCDCSIPACWAAGMCVPCATEECSCAGPNDEPSEPERCGFPVPLPIPAVTGCANSHPCSIEAHKRPSEPAPPTTSCDVTDLDGFPCDAKPCNLHPEGR